MRVIKRSTSARAGWVVVTIDKRFAVASGVEDRVWVLSAGMSRILSGRD
jgi:hypothetical protein